MVGVRPPGAAGSARASRPIAAAVVAGATPPTRAPTFASGVRMTVLRPRRIPRTIRRAARSASIDTNGREAPGANQAYSRGASPVNSAWRCDPVRIRPGATVVAVIPVPASSARRPLVNPTAPNFAVL